MGKKDIQIINGDADYNELLKRVGDISLSDQLSFSLVDLPVY